MDLHLPLDRSKPLRAQLEAHLRGAIRSGRLQPEVRLPPSRMLATQLGVSRGVVVEAYAQLTAEGYLQTFGSGGTRVAPRARAATVRRDIPERPIRFDLRAGLPDSSLFPRRAWAAATATVLRELPDAALLYGPSPGHRRLRRAIATYLGRVRAIRTDEERTLITCGASHAFSLLWGTLRGLGVNRVAHEDPVWGRIPDTIAQAGLEPVPIRVDPRGLSIRELWASDVQAVVVSPAHQYPSGTIMHPSRRERLINWARETGGLIVEDDYDAEYRYTARPIAPISSVAPEVVAYVGTTSKTLAPELRLGWLIVPDHLAEAVSAQHAVSHAQPSVINQAVFAALLDGGEVDRHLRRTRAIYQARREALLRAMGASLPSVRLTGGAAGIHLMAWLSPEADEPEVVAEAMNAGVAVDGLHGCCSVRQELGPALVLGYGAVTEAAIPTAVDVLARSMSQTARGENSRHYLPRTA